MFLNMVAHTHALYHSSKPTNMGFLLLLAIFSFVTISLSAPLRQDAGCHVKMLRCRSELDFDDAAFAVQYSKPFLLPHSCLIYVAYCTPNFPELLAETLYVPTPVQREDGSTVYVQRPDFKSVTPDVYSLLHTFLSEMHGKLSSRSKPVPLANELVAVYVGTNDFSKPERVTLSTPLN